LAIPQEVEAFHFERAVNRVISQAANVAAFENVCGTCNDDTDYLKLSAGSANGQLLAREIKEAYDKT